MRILLTNDDGVHAEGLHALRRRLEEEGHAVTVVAPERERSATGHAITLHKPLHVHPIEVAEARSPIWSVNGTPVDCAKLGVSTLAAGRPELLISGINRGANVGLDILYSGTVSAAFEGIVAGIPACAVSVAGYGACDFGPAARFMGRLVRRLASQPLAPATLLNINVPAVAASEIDGLAITRLGIRYYTDVFHPRKDPRGRTYYWLAGTVREEDDDPETDVGALHRKQISITPLRLSLVDEELLSALRKEQEALRELARGLA